jgi:hypothetical protein
VDVRNGPLGHAVQDKLFFFERTDPAFLKRATLWVSEATEVPKAVQALRDEHGLSVRLLPELLPSDNIGKCTHQRGKCNGHIGKAYALLHATEFRQETASLVFDGDTQLCNGWLEKVLSWLGSGKQLMWAAEAMFWHSFTQTMTRTM